MLAQIGQPLHLEFYWTCYFHHYGMFSLILGSVCMCICIGKRVHTKWEEQKGKNKN